MTQILVTQTDFRIRHHVIHALIGIIHYEDILNHPLGCTCLLYKSFENTVGKGEIARNEQFLLSPQCFVTILENFMPFSSNLKLLSANSFSLESSKFCRLGKVKVPFSRA